MKAQGLILGLLLPCLALAQQQYYGSRASKMALSGADSEADLSVVPIHPGDIITVENVRASIQALYDTARYRYVEVDAEAAPDGGTVLNFRVIPNSFFSTFRLEPDNLLDRALSSQVRLPIGERFTTAAVEPVVRETVEILKSEGYFGAKVTPDYEFDNETHLVSVTLKAETGNKAKVGAVRLAGGEETFPHRELLKEVKLKTGDNFSKAKLDKTVADIRTKFTDLSFLNTRVTADTTYNAGQNTVDLDIRVQPGQFVLVETRPPGLVSKKKIKELVPVYEEGTVDKDLVDEGGTAIIRYLQEQGYFDAELSSEIIRVEPPLGNAIQINYMVTIGPKHQITIVEISGNQHFMTDDIKARIKTRSGQFLSRGEFSSEILEEDRRTIEGMYNAEGFEGTTVTTRADDIGHAIKVSIKIQEGKRLRIESISISGNSALTEAQLREVLSFKENELYTPAKVDEARAAITQLYFTKGYPDVRVDRSVEHTQPDGGIHVSFEIVEGQAYRFGMILVAGNTLTKDKVIRRRSGLESYAPYDPQAILEAQQKLYATGLFSRVEIVSLEQGIPGVRNLLIQVEDAKPILMTYGVGFQEYEHTRGTFEISHNNLLGMNRSLSLRVRASSRERLAQSTFKEPHLFNHDLDGFVSAFIEYTQQPFFTANRIDFSVQALKRFTPQRNFLVTAGYQTVNLQDIRVNPLADVLPAERGIIQIARVGASYVEDRRDDPINPKTGTYNTTTFQIASRGLGSEINFTSLYNQYNVYTPIGSAAVLATSVRFGWNHPFGRTTATGLPPTERYFAGGSTTLRGFGYDEAQPSGGNVMTLGNVEYRFPLRAFPIKNVRGAFFYDTGNVFPTLAAISLGNFTHTVGFGFRYVTPLGPVRLDFGFNLKPDINGQTNKVVHVFFTLGNPF
jgi:outer membrane protein assembly complex protein YaeT